MKLSIIVLVSVLVACTTALFTGNGQPGCKTDEELSIGVFRNNWDPTAYWKCVELNEPAVLERCPTDQAFMANSKECVEWNEWMWEDPVEPLSQPDD